MNIGFPFLSENRKTRIANDTVNSIFVAYKSVCLKRNIKPIMVDINKNLFVDNEFVMNDLNSSDYSFIAVFETAFAKLDLLDKNILLSRFAASCENPINRDMYARSTYYKLVRKATFEFLENFGISFR